MKVNKKTLGLVSLIFILIVGTSLLIFIFSKPFKNKSDGKTYSSKQIIGGVLKSNVNTSNKINGISINQSNVSFDCVKYIYYFKGRQFNLGEGVIFNKPWIQYNEIQLDKFEKWIILKTGGNGNFDKIIFGKLENDKWFEFEFSTEKIESDKLWVASNIKALKDYGFSSAFIKNIDHEFINVTYTFFSQDNNKEVSCNILYRIDLKTGLPNMIEIK